MMDMVITLSYYEVPSEGQLTLREEITIDGPYFTPFNGWTQNGATHQQIFRLEKGKRYSFKMEGITLADPELHILGPLDIANKRYSVLQQPNLGTVTINKHTDLGSIQLMMINRPKMITQLFNLLSTRIHQFSFRLTHC